jgi:hypothetical protein
MWKALALTMATGCILLSQTHQPKGRSPSPSSQPFGLKGDVLGETIDEFRAHNERIITLGYLGTERAKFAPELPKTKHLPQCSNDEPDKNGNPSRDVQALTEEEKRAGVIKCIAALSLNDDLDFEDGPTVAGVNAVRTLYYFFHLRLYMIKSTLPGSEYPALRSAFIQKYGSPLARIAQYQNSMGGKFTGEELLWRNGVSQIQLGQRDGERDDPATVQLKDMEFSLKVSKVHLEATTTGGYETKLHANAYLETLQLIRERNKSALEASNALVTIWHTVLRKECEAAGSKDRRKDM